MVNWMCQGGVRVFYSYKNPRSDDQGFDPQSYRDECGCPTKPVAVPPVTGDIVIPIDSIPSLWSQIMGAAYEAIIGARVPEGTDEWQFRIVKTEFVPRVAVSLVGSVDPQRGFQE